MLTAWLISGLCRHSCHDFFQHPLSNYSHVPSAERKNKFFGFMLGFFLFYYKLQFFWHFLLSVDFYSHSFFLLKIGSIEGGQIAPRTILTVAFFVFNYSKIHIT